MTDTCSTENTLKQKYLKKLHHKLFLFKYHFSWNRVIKICYLPNDKRVLLHKSVKTNKSVHAPISFWGPHRSKCYCFVLISSLKVSWPAWPCCLTFLWYNKWKLSYKIWLAKKKDLPNSFRTCIDALIWYNYY